MPRATRTDGPDGEARVVALTGAASFLGRSLVELFESDPTVERVVSLDVARPPTAREKTVQVDVDLTRAEATDVVAAALREHRVDALYHLAFLASASGPDAYRHELEAVGTVRVLAAARLAPLRRLIVASQTVLYGALPSNPGVLTEDLPLRADPADRFFADKVDAEREVDRYRARERGTIVVVLRTAPILGPTTSGFVQAYLRSRVVPTVLGFDPVWQFVHETDAVRAFRLALGARASATLNVVGSGVLPLSQALRLSGRTPLPMFEGALRAVARTLWGAQISLLPPSFVSYLRYPCVASGARAERAIGFRAELGSRDALLDWARAERLRAAPAADRAG